jgi:predicted nucleic acid-binding protein
VILDTSVLIAAERGLLRFEAFLLSIGDQSVGISAVTASELLHGCARATNASVRARRAAFVEGILGLVPVFPFGLPEARRHAELWADLVQSGTPVGAHDLMIGATAVARGETLVTLNRREFSRIPGVALADLSVFLS